MIYEVAQYGGALFWLLLFFGIYMMTVFAQECQHSLRANIWTGLTFFYVFCFTSYKPDATEFGMGVFVYLLIGSIVAVMKWIQLVGRIKSFDDVVDPISYSDLNRRNLLYKAFKPSDVDNDLMTLPPDPSEFRTCISMWFMYWPAFTILKPLAKATDRLRTWVWKGFHRLSRIFYDE